MLRRFSVVGPLSVLLLACHTNEGHRSGTDPANMEVADGGSNQPPDARSTNPFTTGSIGGRVWAPGNAPGMVPLGQEIPISNALVFVSLDKPDPIPEGVYCDKCVDPPGTSVFTDPLGAFKLERLEPGPYWLVIQKGQFRIEQEILIGPGESVELPTDHTTLPSIHDPANGMWLPHIALAEGLWDQMEDILGKMQIGQVDSSGRFVGSSAEGHFDLYINGDGDYGDDAIGSLNSLVGDLEKMKKYHIILVPCSDGDNSKLFTDVRLRENIRQYVELGGKFYVTDWSAEWEDVVFPEFIRFNEEDTPVGALPDHFGTGDGISSYTSHRAKATDTDLAVWLDGQKAPLVVDSGFGSDYIDGNISSKNFVVEGNWDRIADLPQIMLGMDEEGLPVIGQAKTWVMGDWDEGEGPIHPLTVTFEPAGCGRVLYSTYHTADSTHVGLVPQERVLLYLLMEIGVCKSGPVIIN